MDLEFFLRFLNERHAAVRRAVDQLLQVLPENNPKAKAIAVDDALREANTLASAMSEQDRPPWIGTLQKALTRYSQRSQQDGESYKLLKGLIDVYAPLNTQTWVHASDDDALDFEAVYRRYTDESRLAELFDEMIGKIEGMLTTGQVDSNKVLRALEAVLATLKRNVRSSYFARRGAWQVASIYFRNFLWEALDEIPGVKAPVRALRKTFADLEKEFKQVGEHANDEIVRFATTSKATLSPPSEPRLLAAPNDAVTDEVLPAEVNDASE